MIRSLVKDASSDALPVCCICSYSGAESLHMAVNSFVYTTASAFLRSLHYEVLIEHRVNPFKLYPVRLFHTRIESDLCRATRGGYSSPSMLSSQSLIAKWALSRVSRKLWAAMKRKVNDLFLLLYKKHVYSNNVFSLNEGLYKKKTVTIAAGLSEVTTTFKVL